MNIFFLDSDPTISAHMQCDQHVVKMPLESAQMLCSAFPQGHPPYKRTHYNHPCSIWVRKSKENYCWLIEHGLALCEEFKFRYDKGHSSEKVIYWCFANMEQLSFPTKGLTEFPQTIPDKYKSDDAIKSYRLFYMKEKAKFAKWAKRRGSPPWYLPEKEEQLT